MVSRETHELTHLLAAANKWAPIARGNLARPFTEWGKTARSEGESAGAGGPRAKSLLSPASQEIIRRVEELAKKKGWKMSHVALAWINQRVTSPIVGLSSLARLDEAVELRGKDLTPEEAKYLEEPYEPLNVDGHA